MLEWFTWQAQDLTTQTLYEILRLRTEVFVVEQNCPYQELDNRDLEPDTRHIACYEAGELIAYCRILKSGKTSKIGRVVVHQKKRGGLGSELLKRAVNVCCTIWPDQSLALSAQEHLQGFYGKHGFSPVGDVYLEDGIPHIEMVAEAQ